MPALVCAGISLIFQSVTARAEDAGDGSRQPTATVVVHATAIPGSTIDADKFPGNVEVLSSADLTREGSASLTGALNSQLGSINIDDNLDDPFQPDILYRGFEASPVLGTPQGLAVYQNGVRINEAFGDTVDWDLFPDIAINRVELVSSSPVYGLNALGGAVSITMKNGFDDPGGECGVVRRFLGSSIRGRRSSASVPITLRFYVAGRALDQTGWRLFSDDKVRQLYTALSARGDSGSLDLTYTLANNALNGQGAAPVQELAISRALVFTGPQQYLNRLNFFTLNGSLNLTQAWSVQAVAYYRQFSQSLANGNTTDFTSCTAPPTSATCARATG